MHGGGPKVTPGLPIPGEYTRENLKLVEQGIPNMLHHISIIKKAGINPVVCINVFHTDTKEEIAMVKRAAESTGCRCAVSTHWEFGGEGALELADMVKEACDEGQEFKFHYPQDMNLRDRVEFIAKEIYGAEGVRWSRQANEKATGIENDPQYDDYATIMVKTPLSLSHDPELKGVPRGWWLPIRDILIYSGARFLCMLAGEVNMLPGTGSNPAFRRIDIDPVTGKVHGLF
jgi:formate--tetrahydrofolate ligase